MDVCVNFNIFLYMHVHSCVFCVAYVCARMLAGAWTCIRQRLMLNVFASCSLPYFIYYYYMKDSYKCVCLGEGDVYNVQEFSFII